jgi:hypothetical protein
MDHLARTHRHDCETGCQLKATDKFLIILDNLAVDPDYVQRRRTYGMGNEVCTLVELQWPSADYCNYFFCLGLITQSYAPTWLVTWMSFDDNDLGGMVLAIRYALFLSYNRNDLTTVTLCIP